MDGKQVIVAIGYEYGSDGDLIAGRLAEKLGFTLYGCNLLQEIAEEKNIGFERLEKYGGIPKKRFLRRAAIGGRRPPQEQVFRMQCRYLKEKAAAGESFIAVEHCAERIFKDWGGLAAIFISGDMDRRVERASELCGLSLLGSQRQVRKLDRGRNAYYRYYCGGKWGSPGSYDLVINSSRLGIGGTADVLEAYIRDCAMKWQGKAWM